MTKQLKGKRMQQASTFCCGEAFASGPHLIANLLLLVAQSTAEDSCERARARKVGKQFGRQLGHDLSGSFVLFDVKIAAS